MVNAYISKLVDFVKSEQFIINTILILSITSAHFASYILAFDINALLLIDPTSILSFTTTATILYVFISLGVLLFLYIGKTLIGYLLFVTFPDIKASEMVAIRILMSLFENKLVKYASIILVFSYFYIGIMNTLYFIITIIIVIIVVYIGELTYQEYQKSFLSLIENERIKGTEAKSENIIYENISIKGISPDKKSFINFLSNKVAIILVLCSILLGGYRALYIQNHNFVKMNENKYSLYITTSSGIGLYDNNSTSVIFISWDNVSNLNFIASERKYFAPFKPFN